MGRERRGGGGGVGEEDEGNSQLENQSQSIPNNIILATTFNDK